MDCRLSAGVLKVLQLEGPRRLLGAFHPAPRLQPRGVAVLLCNPFGEEAARAHRIYRVLATQLARQGYPTLRFDYGGTGDSGGDDHDATIAGWLGDVTTAAAHLGQLSGARRLAAVGLRFGATLAALATTRAELRLRHLVLWDPIVDGGAYLDELADMHARYLHDELGDARARAAITRTEGREALGAALPPPLVAELRALDLVAEPPRADHLTVISTRPSPALERLRARTEGGAGVRWITPNAADADEADGWNSDAALNAQIVPMPLVQTVITRIEEVSP